MRVSLILDEGIVFKLPAMILLAVTSYSLMIDMTGFAGQ